MLLEYYGHSCFACTDGAGRRLIIDPYDPTVGYRVPDRPADVTLVSHDHFDHNHVAGVRGRTQVLRGGGERQVEGIRIRALLADHDAEGGSRLGHVTVFLWEMDGLVVVHLSDLGGPLSSDVRKALGRPDVLLVPTGGADYTLGPAQAAALVRELRPRRVVPMHYRTPFLNRTRIPDLEPLEPFLQEFRARPLRESSVEISGPGAEEPEILALTHMM